MKVLHIIDTIAQKSGGPARSSQGLVAALNDAGVDAFLFSCCVGDKPWLMESCRFRVPSERGMKNLSNKILEVIDEITPELIHIHGIWRPEAHIATRIAKKRGMPYVVSPKGMLDPWALRQKWWKKIPAWILYQRKDLCEAMAFHATSEQEARNIRKKGFKQNVILSPNGVAVPSILPARTQKEAAKKTALFLSRLHPGKGLMRLAEAWGRVRPEGWQMRVVGFDGYGEKARVMRRLEELGIGDWVFEDPMNDGDKWQAFVDADLFVHPSNSENFGISIAEAMYAGLPVITTKGAPWQELETNKCGWWIDLPPQVDGAADWQALDSALIEAMRLGDDERVQMGERGRKLVEEKYTWSAVVKRMVEGYREITKMRSKARRYGRRGAKSDFSFCLQLINNNGKIQEIQH